MQRRIVAVALFAAALLMMAIAALNATVQAAPPVQELKGDAQRGAYVFAAAAGCGCHITAAGFLAGGQKFDLGPAGVVYSRNITSDPETGIGNWTEAEIVTTIRTGKTPDGETLFPVMPYMTYSGMADQDAYDLAAFIKTAPPIKNETPKDDIKVPIPPFSPPKAPATAPTEGVTRGEYLVKNVSDCSGCHTPTDAQGAPDMTKFLAGAPIEGELSANITPDKETGIGNWTEEQIANLLKTGQRPDGSAVSGLMALVVQGGFSKLTDADRAAIAAYLKTIPAVNNVPKAPAALPSTGGNLYNLPLTLALVSLGGVLLIVGVFVWRSSARRKM
ncbi:MAG: cytochrome c [Chloroflexi bacterium]|nr:cytochrome c [Chloroflexota bacterium]